MPVSTGGLIVELQNEAMTLQDALSKATLEVEELPVWQCTGLLGCEAVAPALPVHMEAAPGRSSG